MNKKKHHDVPFKLKAVKRLLELKESKSKISSELGINESTLRKWVRYYKYYGIKGLASKSNTYTLAFKLKVLQQMKKRCLSLKQASLEYGIPSDSTVLTWLRIYEQEGKLGLSKITTGRPKKMPLKKTKKQSKVPLTREQKLVEENKSLRAELDLLKKLDALIQAREVTKKKH